MFLPKYRREVLTNQVETRLKEIIGKMAYFHDWIIEAMEVMPDHVHLFLSAPPRYSPAEIVKLIKSWTQKALCKEFKEIRRYLWGGSLWSEGYFVSTVNDSTTKDEIKKYIEDQKRELKQLGLWDIKAVGFSKNPRPSTGGVV